MNKIANISNAILFTFQLNLFDLIKMLNLLKILFYVVFITIANKYFVRETSKYYFLKYIK